MALWEDLKTLVNKEIKNNQELLNNFLKDRITENGEFIVSDIMVDNSLFDKKYEFSLYDKDKLPSALIAEIKENGFENINPAEVLFMIADDIFQSDKVLKKNSTKVSKKAKYAGLTVEYTGIQEITVNDVYFSLVNSEDTVDKFAITDDWQGGEQFYTFTLVTE